MPVLPVVAAKVIAGATRSPSGCLISPLSPESSRPRAWIPSEKRFAHAARVVAAAKLNQPIKPDEDVHHTCKTGRCVEPEHLTVETVAEHLSGHARERKQTHCSVHQRPYDRTNARGWGVCNTCNSESQARHRRENPDAPPTREQKDRANELNRRRRKTPEARVKAAAWQRTRRALRSGKPSPA